MNIKIIANNIKLNTATNGALKEYGKRLSRYCKFSFLSLKKEKEVVKHLSPSASIFCLIPSKSTISSEELAEKIKTLGITGHSEIIFFIGFSVEYLENCLANGQAMEQISISSLQFSAPLTSAVLSEQIYRAYRIINKEPYHK